MIDEIMKLKTKESNRALPFARPLLLSSISYFEICLLFAFDCCDTGKSFAFDCFEQSTATG